MIKNLKVEILSNNEIAPMHYKLALKNTGNISDKILPGQFIHIKISDAYEPLLRRPFSVFNTDKEKLEVLYKVIGRGTDFLSKKKTQERVDIIAPCGNCFPISAKKDIVNIIVAGGMGIAPLHALASELIKKKREIIVFLGARTKKLLICEKELEALGVNTVITTEDGSAGKKGLVSAELKRHLPKLKRGSVIYACGPHLMMEEVSNIAKSYGIQSWVSLEERMACGVGACMGCSVLTRGGYKNVCSDGPVFDSKEIIW